MAEATLPSVPASGPQAGVGAMAPHDFFDTTPNVAWDRWEAATGGLLVRQLFDVGLQLHVLRAAFDRPHADPEARTASAGVGVILDELDILIRDAGLAALTRLTGGSGNGRPEAT